MMDRMRPNCDRLDHLLADRTLFGLSQPETIELASLAANFPEAHTDCFDHIAACVDLALGTDRFEPMSDRLQAVIQKGGRGPSPLQSRWVISDGTTE